MNYGEEFKKYAIKDQGISSTYYEKIMSSMYPSNLTPNIIEERQMNIAIFDVFPCARSSSVGVSWSINSLKPCVPCRAMSCRGEDWYPRAARRTKSFDVGTRRRR